MQKDERRSSPKISVRPPDDMLSLREWTCESFASYNSRIDHQNLNIC
jgi:hypothetical protein